MNAHDAYLSMHYVDPPTGVNGYLVIDVLKHGLAAGGIRVHPEVTDAEVAMLARNMTLKQAVAGIEVGGAKAGLQMEPTSPKRSAVLRRFLEAIRPMILHCFSAGPDMNTSMAELEGLARELGIPALKIAVARAKGIEESEFLRRYRLFEAQVGPYTVNQLRGGASVYSGVLELLSTLDRPLAQARVAIQGAGNMGRAAAHLLNQTGVSVVAWADDLKTLVDPDGLDVASLLAQGSGGRLPDATPRKVDREQVLAVECDVLVLAAVAKAISEKGISRIGCRSIVCAANLALEPQIEVELERAGVVVLPDIVASSGGSLAVEALYRGVPNGGEAVLAHVERRARAMMSQFIAASRSERRTVREVALRTIG